MKIFISGAAGVVGKSLSDYLHKAGHQIIGVDIINSDNTIYADLRDENSIFELVSEYNPEIILHLASIKNLNYCENNKAETHLTNYGVTEILTRVCLAHKIRLIFFSSDYVFGKYDRFWREVDTPCPTTQYGIDKAESEKLIQNTLCDFAIIRTAQIYGFPGDFVSLVYQTLNSHQTFTTYSNLINCPTWIGDISIMLNKIIQYNKQGIFHCVGLEALSRYQFANEIAEVFSLEKSHIVAENLDFSTDIRPPIVRLNGAYTYNFLQVYPGKLKKNISENSSYIKESGLRE